MQRIVACFAAVFSLFTASLHPAQAQQTEVAPAQIVQSGELREGAETGSLRTPVSATTQTGNGSTVTRHTRPMYHLGAHQTQQNLVVRDRTFVLEGRVIEDVLAINCHTIIKPSASVGHIFTAVGGTVDNEGGNSVQVIQQSAELLSGLEPTFVPVANATNRTALPQAQTVSVPTSTPVMPVRVVKPHRDWTGGQFALLLLGLLAGALAVIVAPRATERTGEELALQPARCLGVGMLGACAMLFALFVNYGLAVSPLGGLWKPFGAGFAAICLGVLAFGWLCGMRYVGQHLAKRSGQSHATMLIQIAAGLAAFFLVNVILGHVSTSLGVVGLLCEFGLALTGLGAAVLAGFGKPASHFGKSWNRSSHL